MEKNVEVSLLFSFYKNMLTPKQADAIDLYYNEDLSLSEIGEEIGITRQGVRDNIKRAESILYATEEKLGLVAKFLRIKDSLKSINDIIGDLEKSPKIALLPNEIKQKINDIIVTVSKVNEEY